MVTAIMTYLIGKFLWHFGSTQWRMGSAMMRQMKENIVQTMQSLSENHRGLLLAIQMAISPTIAISPLEHGGWRTSLALQASGIGKFLERMITMHPTDLTG